MPGPTIVEEILLARVRSLLTIKQQFVALHHQAEEMRRIAGTDSLTGVRSKRYLLDQGPDLLGDPGNQPVCAILLDIDHFKQINDKLGHITGDHVLAALGETLNRCIDDPGIVVRFGGEEFAIILPAHNLKQGQAVGEAIRQRIETLRPAGVPLTVSIGLATTQNLPNADLTRLLQLADEALYNAKATGRNRVCAAPDRADCP
jgi:two-component system cell cycle response regulator